MEFIAIPWERQAARWRLGLTRLIGRDGRSKVPGPIGATTRDCLFGLGFGRGLVGLISDGGATFDRFGRGICVIGAGHGLLAEWVRGG